MQAAEIRKLFLDYFRARAHEIVASSSVVPHDDPTLLFANAGMNQFKKIFTGEETRDPPRAASSQKCIRAGGKHNDLDNVGYTKRHLTFFEMLGNFSFGDYFKREACEWAWDLVTREFRLAKNDLWITIHHSDDEARNIWRDHVGVPDARILGLGDKDNFWMMGEVGPCGPCSEIHVDRGAHLACGPHCGLGKCDCDRYLEIWNLVFMQYEQRPGGERVPLPRPSIDTGMGLERISLILQNRDSVFETDVLRALIDHISTLTQAPYESGAKGTPHRVIADHIRTLAFAIADGAFPSNEGRGYVLRRILRRAVRYGYKLGMEKPFIFELVPTLAGLMGDAFPELRTQQSITAKLVRGEEEQFGKTLKQGVQRFDEEVRDMEKRATREFSAGTAFFLHDTCGFPIDLTEQMCREKNLTVDRAGFEKLMDEQRERSQQIHPVGIPSGIRVGTPSLSQSPPMGNVAWANLELAPTITQEIRERPPRFVGYDTFDAEGKILEIQSLRSSGGPPYAVFLDATPFYAEGGGQVGDTGIIEGRDFKLRVTDTRRRENVIVHTAELEAGDPRALEQNAPVRARIDAARRLEIQRNHTATHLVHAALRQVLGKHVQQKGSLVAPDRLRFDISHFERVAPEQLTEVETIVQEQILKNSKLVVIEEEKEKALARGAMAFFGEKYGDRVRVVEIPGFSVELCGGAHCAQTGEIGAFLVLSESSVSSGVRRLEAVTGFGAQRRGREAEETIRHLAAQLRAGREELVPRVDALLAEIKDLRSGKGAAKGHAPARDLLAEIDSGARGERKKVGDYEIFSASFELAPDEELLRVSDSLKQRPGRRVYILTSTTPDGGVRLLAGTSKEVPAKLVHSGEIVKAGAQLMGGGGGGRPDLAQAGGKDASQLPAALSEMLRLATERVSGRA